MVKALLNDRTAKETLLVLIGQVGFVSGGLALARVLALALGPEGYGSWALIFSIISILTLLVHGPLGQWFLRSFATLKAGQKLESYREFLQVILSYGLCAPIVLGLFFLLGWDESLLSYVLALGLGLLYGNVLLLQNVFTAQRSRGLTAGIVCLDIWLKVALAYIGFFWLGVSFLSWLLLFGLSSFATVWCYKFFSGSISRKLRFSAGGLPWKSLWQYSAPLAILGALAAIVTQVDKWIVAGATDAHELGLYAAAVLVGITPFHLLTYFIGQLFSPLVFDAAGAGTDNESLQRARSKISLVVGLTFVGSVVLIVIIYFFSEILIRLLTSSQFLEAKHMLLPLAVSGALFQVGQMFNFSAMVVNKTKAMIVPKMAHALSFFLLAIYWAQSQGGLGVAWAHLASSALYLIFMYRMHRNLHQH